MSLRFQVQQDFGISAELRQSIDQDFGISADLRQSIEQVFALPERMILWQRFSDAPSVRRTIYQVFGDMREVRRSWLQKFGDAVSMRKTIEQVFSMPDLLRMVLDQDFAITANALRQVTQQEWSILDVDLLRRSIYQVFSIQGLAGSSLRYTITTTINGEAVDNPASINIERDIDLYYIDATLTIAGQAAWTKYIYNADVVLTINAVAYHLVVISPKRDRRHGGSIYTVDLQSPAARLGQGFADPVSGELTGMASAIAAALAPGFTIDWQIQDEYYGPGVLIAAEEYPIEIIRKLALAMKGVVQSSPDGTTLTVIYRRPIHVDRREDVEVDYVLTDAEDFYTAAEAPVRRPGYNKYTIRNQNVSDAGLRMEENTISRTLKEIRGYQTPWVGDFDLTHTGGSWVSITPMPIEERQETEIVEFVDGKGRTGYPIFAKTSIKWQQTNLGTVTFNEDGNLESSVVGDSLLDITYTTRCKVWQVRNAISEQLQLVSEADA